ncbi:MAG: aminoglycoside phosphotransferase family protein, partial [Chloroflexota bacterium]|nr:aminoglycoside phosphotransferase family protein [Chloroflexota bacterium]
MAKRASGHRIPRDRVLDIVQDALPMREVLGQHLRIRDAAAVAITACRVGKVRLGHGYRYLIEYHVTLQPPDVTTPLNVMVTGMSFPAGRTREVWETLRDAGTVAIGATDLVLDTPFAYVPDLDMLVQVFPHDFRLPGLARLLAGCPPELLPSLLAEFGPGTWRLERWDAESMAYAPDRRAAVRLIVQARCIESGRVCDRTFYAKIYPNREEACRAHQLQVMLHQGVDTAAAPFRIAKPIAYLPDLQTVVHTAVSGVSLDHLVANEPDAGDALDRAARAIAALHHLEVDFGGLAGPESPRSLANRITRLERESALLSTARPHLAAGLARMVATIIDGLTPSPSAPTHGDLKPEHVFIDGDTVSLIDFDFLQASDRVLDVLKMEKHLASPRRRVSSSTGGAEASARRFVEAYLAHAAHDARARLALY